MHNLNAKVLSKDFNNITEQPQWPNRYFLLTFQKKGSPTFPNTKIFEASFSALVHISGWHSNVTKRSQKHEVYWVTMRWTELFYCSEVWLSGHTEAATKRLLELCELAWQLCRLRILKLLRTNKQKKKQLIIICNYASTLFQNHGNHFFVRSKSNSLLALCGPFQKPKLYPHGHLGLLQ